MAEAIGVLCAGFACHDLIFSVERHPGPDEKVFASQISGQAAAALCCCKFGARRGMPSHRAVDKFIHYPGEI